MFFYYKKLFCKYSNVKDCGPFDIKFNFKSKKKIQDQEIPWNQSIQKKLFINDNNSDNITFYVSDINYLYNLMKDDVKIILPKINYDVTYNNNNLKLNGKRQYLRFWVRSYYDRSSVSIHLKKNNNEEIINKMFIIIFFYYHDRISTIHK